MKNVKIVDAANLSQSEAGEVILEMVRAVCPDPFGGAVLLVTCLMTWVSTYKKEGADHAEVSKMVHELVQRGLDIEALIRSGAVPGGPPSGPPIPPAPKTPPSDPNLN